MDFVKRSSLWLLLTLCGGFFSWLSASNKIRLCRYLSRRAPTLFKSRYKIILCNLKLCFPNKGSNDIEALAQKNIESTLLGYLDTFASWRTPMSFYSDTTQLENIEVVNQLRKQGKGVLILGGHFTCLDIAGIATSLHLPLCVSYKPHKNPIFDQMINRSRRRWASELISVKQPVALVKTLKQGKLLWYAPDQDFGPRSSIFSPFFNVPTATTKAISRMVKMTDAAIVPVLFYRDPVSQKVVVRFQPPLDTTLGHDDIIDAYNASLETNVRNHPEQYLWSHRRFKTRPPGAPQIYQQEQYHA